MSMNGHDKMRKNRIHSLVGKKTIELEESEEVLVVDFQSSIAS